MKTRLALVLISVGAAMGRPALPQQVVDAPDATPPAFVLRVNPKLTTEINEVLARVAQRMEVVVPAGHAAEEYLVKICGGRLPAYETTERPDTGATRVRVAPCVRVKRNLRIEVTAGDTLEGLAVRNGLPRTVATRLKVIPAGESKTRPTAPKNLQIGDVVVLPEVPLWTHVVMNPEVVADRAALVAALADRLKCGAADAETCLAEREITVLDRATVRRPKEPEPEPAPVQQNDLSSVVVLGEAAELSRLSGMMLEMPMADVEVAAATDPASLPPPPPLPAPPPAMAPLSIPVAPEQWPYDAGLLAEILKDAADAGYIRARTVIGVADGGLGNLSGSPLPETLFDIGTEKLQEISEGRHEPDGDDNDGNLYVDDIFGAGVPRVGDGELMGTGDLGLCKAGQPPFATWASDPLREASHGAVVSSIAAALGLRKTAPQIENALPKLVFFRMLESACTQDASLDVAEGEMALAFDYLMNRSNVINISFTVKKDVGAGFASRVKDFLRYMDVLLVLPAGNDGDNLEVDVACPACLGNDGSDFGDKSAKRVLVVGAATRDLRRASFSNYGERTVGIFAPGEPTGALDLVDQEIPSTDAATSYAAPLAALGAAIVRSFGDTNSPMDIKDRLLAATWPLDDSESRPDRTHVGVLDLVKAAAVRHHAVEVKEVRPDGELVRRTYVGTLLTPLKDLKLCAGRVFQESLVHAIRLGEPAEDGERQLLIYFREKFDPFTKRRVIKQVPCQPEGEGTLSIHTLTQGDKTFPLSQVTQIQLKWLLP